MIESSFNRYYGVYGYDGLTRFGVIFPNFKAFEYRIGDFLINDITDLKKVYLNLNLVYKNYFFRFRNTGTIIKYTAEKVDSILSAIKYYNTLEDVNSYTPINESKQVAFDTDNTIINNDQPFENLKDKYTTVGAITTSTSAAEKHNFLANRKERINAINKEYNNFRYLLMDSYDEVDFYTQEPKEVI